MQTDPEHDITLLLQQASSGDTKANERLFPAVYEELRRQAGFLFNAERASHTLQPTALVHEVYLRLVDVDRVEWQDRAHFLAVAGRAMRRVLVDHARSRHADKRGGGRARVTLQDWSDSADPSSALCDLLALDEAVDLLREKSDRRATIVELKLFGGLDLDDIAKKLGLAFKTIEADWYLARAWLRKAVGTS